MHNVFGAQCEQIPTERVHHRELSIKETAPSLTWKEFDDQANRIANYLIKDCGIKKGDIVLHLMMNCMEWYASYIAVLKTGATVTPLNFRFASADIKYAADVTKCKVFMFGEQFNARVEPIMKEMDYCKSFICPRRHHTRPVRNHIRR